jgi:hypothetical protein
MKADILRTFPSSFEPDTIGPGGSARGGTVGQVVTAVELS